MARSFGLLLLRLGMGGTMAWMHGWQKFQNRDAMLAKWKSPLSWLGDDLSFYGLLASELLFAGLVAIGLFTRFVAIAPAFAMGVAFWVAHHHDLKEGEMAFLYLVGFATLVFTGGGAFSVDGLLCRNKNRAMKI